MSVIAEFLGQRLLAQGGIQGAYIVFGGGKSMGLTTCNSSAWWPWENYVTLLSFIIPHTKMDLKMYFYRYSCFATQDNHTVAIQWLPE